MKLSVRARERLAQAFVEAIEAELAELDEETVRFAELEAAVELAQRRAGASALGTVVAEFGSGYQGPSRPCACGGVQTTDHYATCRRQTVLGAIRVRRAAYRCTTCGRHECPLDTELGVPAGRTSQRLRARLSLFSAVAPFAEAVHLLATATGVPVCAQSAQLLSETLGEQVAAATAVADPVPLAAPPRRLYLGVDGVHYCSTEREVTGKLAWKEAKVAVCYEPKWPGAPGTGRRSTLAPDGRPSAVADPRSHRYVVQMGTWHDLATKVWHEGQRRGLEQAAEIIVLGDGAPWIRSLVAEILTALPGRVTQMLEVRHAEQHLWTVASACLGTEAGAWLPHPLDDLHQGRVAHLIAAIRTLPAATAEAAQAITAATGSFEERADLMAYPTFRARGLQIGSGLAESACKRLVCQRSKGPGMHWTVAGAQAIATLRAAHLSHRWDEVEAIAAAA
ncbi:MAG: ISKra4 family transposase [Chloroflexi bacterium]|nr:ISKra4 family transposase [Chloroflexota bacterium]